MAYCTEDRLRADERAAAMARKYVWWQSPERALQDRRLLLAQMMTLATADDTRWLVSRVPAAELRGVLREPPAGVFNRRSWAFRRRRLGLDPAVPVIRQELFELATGRRSEQAGPTSGKRGAGGSGGRRACRRRAP